MGTLLAGLARLDDADKARILVNAAGMDFVAGRHEEGLVVGEQALEVARRLGDRQLESEALRNLGLNDVALDRPAAAREHLGAALRVAAEAGDTRQYFRAVHELGEFEREHGDRVRARELLGRAVQFARDADQRRRAAHALHGLGELALVEGDLIEARTYYADALRLASEAASVRAVMYCLAGLATIAALEGDAEHAGRLWGAVRALEQDHVPLLEFDRRRYDAAIGQVAGPAFQAQAAIGYELELEETVAYALRP
jgi:tetratricopeptide (TPR) repeat protein